MQKLTINDVILKQKPDGFVQMTLDVKNNSNSTIDGVQLEVTEKDSDGKVIEFKKKPSFEVTLENISIPAGKSGKIEDIDLGKTARVKDICDVDVVVKGVSVVDSASKPQNDGEAAGQKPTMKVEKGAEQAQSIGQQDANGATQSATQPKPPRKSLNEMLPKLSKKQIIAITAPLGTLVVLVIAYFIVNNTVFLSSA